MLALTHGRGPSVLQVRGQKVLPEDIGPMVIAALRQHEAALAAGSLVVVDLKKSRSNATAIDHLMAGARLLHQTAAWLFV